MVRTRLNIGCRYSTPVRERPLHPTRGHFTPEPSQTQAPVTPATEPERRAGGSLTTMDHRNGGLDARERDKLLFWFAQAGMWGRFSSSTETVIDQDLGALEGTNGGLDALIEQLRLTQGGLRVEPGHFTGWSIGARF